MISTITGTIQSITEQDLTLSIGVISFTLQVPNPQQFQKDTTIELQTYLHWNQEQGPSLFGFLRDLERTVFLLFITCSGIGPKIALAVLSQLGAEQALYALQTSNEKALAQVSGIGAKKAEQIIAHLKHKAQKITITSTTALSPACMTEWTDVSQALTSLNYTRTEIMHAMQHLRQTCTDSGSVSFDKLMRHALSFLAKKT